MKLKLLLAFLLAFAAQAAFAVVNLNTATKDELITLSGIGPAKAQAILDYRAQHGSFKSVEELKDVKGIGAKRFEKLKAELTVESAPSKSAAASKANAKPTAVAVNGEVKAVK
jgi:competence protein ComEA